MSAITGSQTLPKHDLETVTDAQRSLLDEVIEVITCRPPGAGGLFVHSLFTEILNERL